jgi:glycerol-3-phosphate dehydrogenase
MMYDLFGRNQGKMPRHSFLGRQKSLAQMPHMNPDIKFTATYYDAAMDNPERLALDVLRDGVESGTHARAFNYLSAVGFDSGGVVLRDELTGDTLTVSADVVVNTSGPWTDLTNEALGQKTSYMGGTKGSHIVLDNPMLFEACDGREIFFENSDGRIVLMYPIMNRVLVGTTDIPVDMRDEIVCTDEEVDYFFDLVSRVFPHIEINHSQIVYRYSGVRPLPATEMSTPVWSQGITESSRVRSVPPLFFRWLAVNGRPLELWVSILQTKFSSVWVNRAHCPPLISLSVAEKISR